MINAQALEEQLKLQIESFGIDPRQLDPDARAEFIRWNVLALEDELHEFLGEVGWKPWASSRHVNVDEALNELVDAFHFFMNLVLATYGTSSTIPETVWLPGDMCFDMMCRYLAKRRINAERQSTGYTGVDKKCSECHRDLATVPPLPITANGAVIGYACRCGKIL